MSKKKENAAQSASERAPEAAAKAGKKTPPVVKAPADIRPKKATSAEKAKQEQARDLWLRWLAEQVEELTEEFKDGYDIETNLSGTDRRRLVSARVKNNGFIDKSFDVARDNPAFLPPNFDSSMLAYKMRDFEDLRQLMAAVEQLQRCVVDIFITQADSCYKDASRIYNSLKEQKRAKVPGAAALFEILSVYFKSRGKTPTEPTKKQVKRDAKKLIDGKADGEIIIKNETPHMTAGVHEVIDDVHTGKKAVKATVEESEDEGKTKK